MINMDPFNGVFECIKSKYKEVYKKFLKKGDHDLKVFKDRIVVQITNRILLILNICNDSDFINIIKDVQCIIKEQISNFKEFDIEIYLSVLKIFKLRKDHHQYKEVYKTLKGFCKSPDSEQQLWNMFKPNREIIEIESPYDWMAVYKKERFERKDELLRSVHYILEDPYFFNTVMGRISFNAIVPQEEREIIDAMIKSYYESESKDRYEWKEAPNSDDKKFKFACLLFLFKRTGSPVFTKEEFLKLLKETPNIHYLLHGGLALLVLKKLSFSVEQAMVQYKKLIHPKVWRLLTFYESNCATINIDLHTSFLKVGPEILGFTVPFIMEMLRKHTKKLKEENTSKDDGYRGLKTIKWIIICGKGIHGGGESNRGRGRGNRGRDRGRGNHGRGIGNRGRGNRGVSEILDKTIDKGIIEIEDKHPFKKLVNYKIPKPEFPEMH
eukprot:NODE_83_length_22684_cov_0.307934.p3 type:complete len:439 gc:universal NODE_83_length_22684_cov_0.307934:18442-19758(+)